MVMSKDTDISKLVNTCPVKIFPLISNPVSKCQMYNANIEEKTKNMESVRIFMELVVNFDLLLHQMDVKKA